MRSRSNRYPGDARGHVLFASGTCIILNQSTLHHMLAHKHLVNYKVIDDVALGLLARNLHIPVTSLGSIWTRRGRYTPGKIIYRNKQVERTDDVKALERIITGMQDAEKLRILRTRLKAKLVLKAEKFRAIKQRAVT